MVSRSVGERIAAHRRRRGLSQAVLAGLIGRSEPWFFTRVAVRAGMLY
jgi:ribosome-binding protein aMBF1 (putative translation factor)